MSETFCDAISVFFLFLSWVQGETSPQASASYKNIAYSAKIDIPFYALV